MLRSLYQLASGDFELADDIYGLCIEKPIGFAQPRCLIFPQGYKSRGWEVFRGKVVIEKVRRELDLNIDDIYIGGRR